MMLSKMIDICACDCSPTNEEIKVLFKSFKPCQKLPLLTNICDPSSYPKQLVAKNYLDRLLEGYTLKFLIDRSVNEDKDKYYLNENKKLLSITMGIRDVMERQGLNFRFRNKL